MSVGHKAACEDARLGKFMISLIPIWPDLYKLLPYFYDKNGTVPKLLIRSCATCPPRQQTASFNLNKL